MTYEGEHQDCDYDILPSNIHKAKYFADYVLLKHIEHYFESNDEDCVFMADE
jgi:hypothetical protein